MTNEVNLLDCKPDSAWKEKMMMLNKEQIIELLAKEMRKTAPLKERCQKLQKYHDEMEALLGDSDRLGEFLAGL